jgi:hypothetical protein
MPSRLRPICTGSDQTFFSVPKVHFVLGINASALQNSVKARYGAEIDAENYLRKFIHLSFSLPDTIGAHRDLVISKYARKLVQDMALSHAVSNRCIDLLGYVAKGRPVSLRDVEKIMFKIALLPNEAHGDTKMHDLLCALLVTSVVDPDHSHPNGVWSIITRGTSRAFGGG